MCQFDNNSLQSRAGANEDEEHTARKAAIYWTKNGDVVVDHFVEEPGGGDTHKEHSKSGGACWAFWQQASPEELYFRLLQQICKLMTCEGIEPAKVHEAFKVVPEYRLILPRDHPDSLKDDEEHLLTDPLPKFSSGYNVFG